MKTITLIVSLLMSLTVNADSSQDDYYFQQEMSDYRRKVQEDNYARERYMQQQEANDIARQQLKQEKLEFQYNMLFGEDKDRY